MKKLKIVLISKKVLFLYISFTSLILLLSGFIFLHFSSLAGSRAVQHGEKIIAIDPGHGGVDGGTNKDETLEKDINLDISKKLKNIFESKGYSVILTRKEDISLDDLDNSSYSRHQRDLNARVKIINNSNAKLFLSIHVNSNVNRPSTNGSIVFYSNNSAENSKLAEFIQQSLNNIEIDGKKRSGHNPQQADYYILNHINIPGVIVETAFISNATDRLLLETDIFREQLAKAIAEGVFNYLKESD